MTDTGEERQSKYLADIIIPHHDRDDLLRECLKSIPRDKYNVIISSGGTFAENCNKGALRSLTENLIFLNDDALIEATLFDKVLSSPGDIVGVAQKMREGGKHIFGLGGKIQSPEQKPLLKRFFARSLDEVFIPSGYFFKITKSAWLNLGGFNTFFINGAEDVDLFLRALESGYDFDFVTEAGLHLHSQSLGRNDKDIYNSSLLESLWSMSRIKALLSVRNDLLVSCEGKLLWRGNVIETMNSEGESDSASCASTQCLNRGTAEVFSERIEKKIGDTPLISVIIPSRVGETVDSLESLQNQTYKSIEIIIERDEKGEGASVVRNRGARKAKGDFLFFCDNDLVLDPECLENLYRTLLKNPQASWAFGKFYIDGILHNEGKSDAVPPIRTVDWVGYFHKMSTMSLIRREVSPVFDEEMKRYNDWDLWLSLSDRGLEPVFCDHVLFYTKNRKHGISQADDADRIYWSNKLYAKHEVFIFRDIAKKNSEIERLKSLNPLSVRIETKVRIRWALRHPEAFLRKYIGKLLARIRG